MNWFNNLKIGRKLALGFALVLLLLAAIAGYAVYTANKIDADYSYMDEYPMRRRVRWGEVESSFHAIRRSVSHAGFFYGYDKHESNAASMLQTYEKDVAALSADLAEIRQLIQDDPRKTETERADMTKSVEDIKTAIDNWNRVMTGPIIEAFIAGDRDKAVSTMTANAAVVNGVLENILANYDESTRVSNELSAATTLASRQAVTVMAGLSAAAVIIGIFLAFVIARAITKPVERLVSAVGEVAEGKLNVNIDRKNITKDEIGTLTAGVAALVDTILLIVAELENMSGAFKAGDIEAKAETSGLKGSYREVVEGVNVMTGGIVKEALDFMAVLTEFGKGNFSADLPRLPGKKALMNENINRLRNNLKNVSGEINMLVSAARDGELDRRVEVHKYSGDWAALLGSMNELMGAIAEPIIEADNILNNIAAGNFEQQMRGNYKGAFLVIKNAVNETVTNISSYIDEISSVLDAMAQNNLNQSITREYVGDFSSIKNSILNIVANFNNVIAQIYSASDQVASGADSISEGSMSMAQGAAEQASSIEELNATVQVIAESTKENAENAGKAEALSKQSKEIAALGDEDMNNMLRSMDGIKASSDGISKIIKVIDDIAFQTGILSLNAAVEAARAGVHGKGFAVVAEEVRSLAARSQSNARETAQLIEESINRVNEGMNIAGKTAGALRKIVGSVTKVSGIIESITQASQEQSSAISQVMEGINQITGVIQNNSSTTEEAASASEELSSQAEVLRGLVDVFTLKSPAV